MCEITSSCQPSYYDQERIAYTPTTIRGVTDAAYSMSSSGGVVILARPDKEKRLIHSRAPTLRDFWYRVDGDQFCCMWVWFDDIV